MHYKHGSIWTIQRLISIASGLLCYLFVGTVFAAPIESANNKTFYKMPDVEEYQLLENAFSEAFKDSYIGPLIPWYNQKKVKRSQYLNAKSKRELGWGELRINKQQTNGVFLQVPHRFYDTHTAKIGYQWFKSDKIQTLMLNTVHRYSGEREAHNENPTDFAHSPRNPMVAASRAWAMLNNQFLIIQLHGFTNEKRKDQAARNADVILSTGPTLNASGYEQLMSLKNCLRTTLNLKAIVYPNETRDLGGTENVIVQSLNDLGFQEHFLHIELNYETRQSLATHNTQANTFLDCVIPTA